jgi:2-polyprenyl-3-methyl-5-hydroxy-6-metoxy-1,4-benzoquinol methylase
MSVRAYDWSVTGPANGESGSGLADLIIDIIRKRENINSICDLGSGNGYLAGRLAMMGYNVLGIDASETGISLAQKTYPQATFIKGIIESGLSQTIGVGKFDLVVSSDVIEHLYRPSDLFEAAMPLLKRAGGLIVTTPYHGYLKNLALSITGKMDNHFGVLTDGGHIKFFSVETLSHLFEMYGFTDLQFSFYGRAPWLWKNMICHSSLGQ